MDTISATPSANDEVDVIHVAPSSEAAAEPEHTIPSVDDAVDVVPVASSAEILARDAGQDIPSTTSPAEVSLPDVQPAQDLEETAPIDSLPPQVNTHKEDEKPSSAELEPDTAIIPVTPKIPDSHPAEGAGNAMGQYFKTLITGAIPALPDLVRARGSRRNKATNALPGLGRGETLFQRMQRFILGEQQRSTTAAALIETPLRIQPNQGYAMRIHIMGRNEAKREAVGLSSFVQGEIVHIEVRSELYEKSAYIVQRADVRLPGRGYAAEVMMPMQPLSSGPSGRRERLHIFFMDGSGEPLYDRPFVVEILISHLVQSGREGYGVLTIPL